MRYLQNRVQKVGDERRGRLLSSPPPFYLPTPAKKARNPNSATLSPHPLNRYRRHFSQLPTPRFRLFTLGIVVDSTGCHFPSRSRAKGPRL